MERNGIMGTVEIRKVVLIGAGAVGSYFIWGLTHKEGIEFCVVSEGERAQRLKEGIRINGELYNPVICSPEEAAGADLILIAVKYSAIREAAQMAARITGPETIVVSLLNGIDSEDIVAEYVDPSQIVYSFMRIASQRNGSEVRFEPRITGGVFFGEKGTGEKTDRILALEKLFEGTKIRTNFSKDIVLDQWKKYQLNITRNLPQAILGVGCGAYYDSEHVGWMNDALEAEVIAVAKGLGIELAPLRLPRRSVTNAARYSTLQDLDARRHTEVDMFLGVLMEKAKQVGIEVPYAEFTWHCIKALEEKNDGKFDY